MKDAKGGYQNDQANRSERQDDLLKQYSEVKSPSTVVSVWTERPVNDSAFSVVGHIDDGGDSPNRKGRKEGTTSALS